MWFVFHNFSYFICKHFSWNHFTVWTFLTEVIFKYVVLMKPTKLRIRFKLGFWVVYHPWAKTSEKGNFWHERRDQFRRFWGHVLITIQSNWSSANSFFRNRQKFACFLELWPEILIAVNWQWSPGKNPSLSKNWDYWKIAENMVKMHNLVNKSCCKPG